MKIQRLDFINLNLDNKKSRPFERLAIVLVAEATFGARHLSPPLVSLQPAASFRCRIFLANHTPCSLGKSAGLPHLLAGPSPY